MSVCTDDYSTEPMIVGKSVLEGDKSTAIQYDR